MKLYSYLIFTLSQHIRCNFWNIRLSPTYYAGLRYVFIYIHMYVKVKPQMFVGEHLRLKLFLDVLLLLVYFQVIIIIRRQIKGKNNWLESCPSIKSSEINVHFNR